MQNPVALVLDESAFRRAIRDEIRSFRGQVDGRTSAAKRGDLPGESKAWLTNEEAMDYLNLSRPTLARYRRDGKLPYSKVGTNVFYRRADVESLLESGMQEVA